MLKNLINLWNIKRKNALPNSKKGKYHFVVGNPPYSSYPDLDNETRKYLRKYFYSCEKGKPDYYFSFIESALNALAEDGKLTYLVPGNFMKNRYGANLRELLLPSLNTVIDFSHYKVFEKILTSSVILVCDKSRKTDVVCYKNGQRKIEIKISKSQLKEKWIFETKKDEKLISASDYLRASAPVATQLNKVFVINNWKNCDLEYIMFEGHRIERKLLRKAASPRGCTQKREEQIIFPYRYGENNLLIHYDEETFQKEFPNGYRYLMGYKEDLENRDSDDNAKWFEYGRSQLLKHLNQEKLIMSSFVTGNVKLYSLDLETVPYAGLCIIAQNGHSIELVKKILYSQEFYDYVQNVGICTNGESYRISPRDINSFQFPCRLLGE